MFAENHRLRRVMTSWISSPTDNTASSHSNAAADTATYTTSNGSKSPFPRRAHATRTRLDHDDGARDKFRKAFRRISQQACYVRTTDEITVRGPPLRRS